MTAENRRKPPSFEENFSSEKSQTSVSQELNDRQVLALGQLVGGAKPHEIFEALGIPPRTLYDWRTKDRVFMKEYKRLRRELVTWVLDRNRNLAWLATDRFEIQIRDPHPPTSRAAARAVLKMAGVDKALTEETLAANEINPPEPTEKEKQEEPKPPAS